MKGVMKIHNHGKFHLYSISGFQVIKFQMFSWRWNIHEMVHFGGFLGPFSPNSDLILLKFGPGVEHYETKTVYECVMNVCYVFKGKQDVPKVLSFGPF